MLCPALPSPEQERYEATGSLKKDHYDSAGTREPLLYGKTETTGTIKLRDKKVHGECVHKSHLNVYK